MEGIVRQPVYRLAIQLLLWAGIWLLLPLLAGESFSTEASVWARWGFLATGAAILVLLNLWVLLPYFYFQRRFLLYFLLGLTALIVIGLMMEYLRRELGWTGEFRGRMPRRGGSTEGKREGLFSMMAVFRLIPYLISFLGSAFVEITFYTISREKERIQMHSEKLESEMKWLKWQTNPHFLFNALHNIYALAVMKSDQAPDQLLRLSEMLRYMLYECNENRVPLEKEVEYLRNYIALKQLKDSEGLNVSLEVSGPVGQHIIAPMLLLPFVENAFKHSDIENRAHGWIQIRMSVEEGQLHFNVRNSLPQKAYTKDHQGGIGHKNVGRMLDLAYPNRHTLSIEQGTDYFEADLSLNLS